MGDIEPYVGSYRLIPKVDNEKLLSYFHITYVVDGKLSFSSPYWIPPCVKIEKGCTF